jgi:bacteriochlorophyllide a dehydrogenase
MSNYYDSMLNPGTPWQTQAVVIDRPGSLALKSLLLESPGTADVVVEVDFSGISTGTERLLWDGQMPDFPGMGYPLVPGYESVGTVVHAGPQSGRQPGEKVFVPGARCFGDVRGLFGGASRRVVLPGARCLPLPQDAGETSVLLALAATAFHACSGPGTRPPELIVGHGALGRLMARLAVLSGAQPVVWESNPLRREGAQGYAVIDPADDTRRDYHCICDASGANDLLDGLLARLAPGGEIVLAGFYASRLSFDFAPAFLREARMRVAAQWRPDDLAAVAGLVALGRLDLGGLLTHRLDFHRAEDAYRTAFGDPACLKMVLDWRSLQ